MPKATSQNKEVQEQVCKAYQQNKVSVWPVSYGSFQQLVNSLDCVPGYWDGVQCIFRKNQTNWDVFVLK